MNHEIRLRKAMAALLNGNCGFLCFSRLFVAMNQLKLI